MAIYTFRCISCGAKVEVIQKFDDPDPICGCGFVMKKEISSCNFRLNGGGWYKDGYNKPPEKVESNTSTNNTT